MTPYKTVEFQNTLNLEGFYFFRYAEWLKKTAWAGFLSHQKEVKGYEWLEKVEISNCFYDAPASKSTPYLAENQTERYSIDISVPILRADHSRSDSMRTFIKATWPFAVTAARIDTSIGVQNPNIGKDDPYYQPRDEVKNHTYGGNQVLPFERANVLFTWLMIVLQNKRSDFFTSLSPEDRMRCFTTDAKILTPEEGINPESGDENLCRRIFAMNWEAYVDPETFGSYYQLISVRLEKIKIGDIIFSQKKKTGE